MKILTIDFNDKKSPQKLVKSLKETGFAVITNHNIDQILIKKVYSEWKTFH